MTRYYFHIRRHGKLEVDPEGTEFSSVQEARLDAVSAAREIMSDRLMQGEPLNGDVFEITDEQGAVVARVDFKSVIEA